MQLAARELFFLRRVRQVTHLDQHRWHVGAFENPQRGLLERPRSKRNMILKLLLHELGERIRRVEIAKLREVPRNEVDLAKAAAEGRQPFGRERAGGMLGLRREAGRAN